MRRPVPRIQECPSFRNVVCGASLAMLPLVVIDAVVG
uniref:Uncharacterized protein n=1 Tax=Arundo donax TaxID=35708 RepID=A0A0A9EQQ3_ARUDO